jgi:hypothetical protein
MRSEPGLFGPLHFNQIRALLVEYMGIHAITELGSCAAEIELSILIVNSSRETL